VTAKNPYLVNVRDLVHHAGELRERHLNFESPEKLGEGLAWVPAGREIDIELRLESVHEGILITAELTTVADAQSARTLKDFQLPLEVDIQELFAYPSGEPFDYEVQGDHVDLEQVVRDAVVLSLPFQPEDPDGDSDIELAEGITLVLADDEHEAPLDQRWASLAAFREGGPEQTDVSKEER
jgi:uncharacterized protein